MNKPTSTPSRSFKGTRCTESFIRARVAPKLALALLGGLAFIACVLLALPAEAQYIRSRSSQIRVTVPLNTTNSIFITNYVSLNGFGTNVVTLNVSGLPAGASATLSSNSLADSGECDITLYTTNIAEGVYTFSLNGSGTDTNGSPVTGRFNLVLQAGYIWNGTNALLPGDWSTSANWLGGGVPGTNDDVIFTDVGGQASLITNCVINGDVTIASLRFSPTNNATSYHTIQINPGYTLKLTGTNGFSFLRDYLADGGYGNIGNSINVTILGTNATMIVSNRNADFALLNDGQGNNVKSTLDMSGLDNLKATVNRFALGDYAAYPNYANFQTNGYNGIPRRFLPNVYLAKTNVITAFYADPNNYTNANNRSYGLSFLNSERQGTTAQPWFNLGNSNAFFVDGVCLIGANQQAYNNNSWVRFNPALLVTTNIVGVSTNFITNSFVAYFRNTNGGRMSVFTVCDDGGAGPGASNCKGYVDFATGGGYVDMLVDRFYMSRDREVYAGGSSSANIQSIMVIGAGIIDANTAILGFNEHTHATNDNNYLGTCQARLTVSNTAIFKVNGTLTLGYTTDTRANAQQYNTRGEVLIGPGGTVMANTIAVDGGANLSTGNAITLGNNCSFILSNTLASATKRLDTLAFSGTNATMTLFIDGNLTTPYVYVTNFTTASAVNYIQIGDVKNVTYTGGTAQLPLILFGTGQNPAILGVRMPVGFVGSGSIVQNGSTEWDLYISTNAPNTNLLWRAPAGATGTANWDTTSKVWLDGTTGLMTNFNNGDYVRFDDTPGYATNINQAVSVLLPGRITMSNTVLKYTINGAGLQGGGILTKTGTGTLEVDGNASVAIALAQGLLTNAPTGTIGGAAVTAGATLVNLGIINGGIVCAGTAISSGTINGTVGIMGGGVVTNLSGANIYGLPTFQDGALLYNSGTITYPLGYTCTVSSNATFINDYIINGDYLVVNGTLKDTGMGNITLYNTLTINGSTAGTNPVGGLFIPGGDGVGSTKVMGDMRSSANYPGRVSFQSGSRVILKVTNDMNTVVYSGFQDLGSSASAHSYNGCILVITNVGTTPFSDGQVFTMFQRIDNEGSPAGRFFYTGTATNTYPLIEPKGPGTGLAWDLKYLINLTPSPDNNNGKIGIIGTAVNPTNVWLLIMPTNGVITIASYTTNDSIITTNYATNNLIYTTLTWPTNHTGWRLQSQQNTLAVGLSTNWVTVFQTPWTNSIYVTNALITNDCWFYRMVYP